MSRTFEPPAVNEALERFAAGQPATASATRLTEVLSSPKLDAAPIMRLPGRPIVLDLSQGSMALGEPLSGLAVERFSQLVRKALNDAGAHYAYGRWGERRELYQSDLFATEHSATMRDVHLGVDVFCAPGEAVYAPLAGRVTLKANNARELDYGPMVVLEHDVGGGHAFYSLYGHLGLDSLSGLEAGQTVAAGEKIAAVGAPPENGNWAPHLHFQLIIDMLGLGADFPGVAFAAQQAFWLTLSPLPARFFPDCDPAELDGRDRDMRGG